MQKQSIQPLVVKLCIRVTKFFRAAFWCDNCMVLLPEASMARTFAKCVFRINPALFSLCAKIELPLHISEKKPVQIDLSTKTFREDVVYEDHKPK